MSKSQFYYKQFKEHSLVLFDPLRGSYQVLPLWASGPGSDGNKGVPRIPQSSCITGASPSDYLLSYPGHSFGKSYPSTEMHSVYSSAPADWTSVFNTNC